PRSGGSMPGRGGRSESDKVEISLTAEIRRARSPGPSRKLQTSRRLRQEAGAVVEARQVVQARPGARQDVVFDAPGAELVDPDLDLGGVELDDVGPQVAVRLRADDADLHLRAAGDRGAHAEGLGDAGFLDP